MAFFNDDNVGIDRYFGKPGDYLVSKSLSSTDSVYYVPEVLVYANASQLYYTNYISGSYGEISDAIVPTENLDGTVTPPSGSDNIYNTTYYNYEETTLNPQKTWPTSQSIGVMTIPSKLYGDYIQPGSVKIESPNSGTITDDGNGRLRITGSSGNALFVGNVIYEHGMIILANTLTDNDYDQL